MGIRRHTGTGHIAHKSLALLDPLEPRQLFSASPLGTYPLGGRAPTTLTDADGTVAKFTLPAGKGTVTVADDGWHVSVSSAASPLTLTTTGGDGRVSIASVHSSKPLSLVATGARLTGPLALSNVTTVTLGKVSDLSLTSTTPLASLSAVTWSAGDAAVPDSLTAPSVGSLNVKRAFAADLTLTSKKAALNSATVGGAVTGTWSVAGSAGTLKFHTVRSPNLTVRGNVGTFTLDDAVAVAQVASTTGGVIHLRRKGSVSAAKGQDKFQIARNTTLYTASANTYTWSELYQFDHLGRQWTFTKNGKKSVETVLPNTQKLNGRTVYNVQETGPDAGTESYSVDDQGRGHLYQVVVSPMTYRFSDMLVSPRSYRIGVTTRSTSKVSASGSEDGIYASMSGLAGYATRFAGHELVTTPAGTFVAAKLISTLNGSFAGRMSNGEQSINLKASLNGSTIEYAVPGMGIVKYDDTESLKVSAEGESDTDRHSNHAILTKRPVDTAK
jgi:hypothetical protein